MCASRTFHHSTMRSVRKWRKRGQKSINDWQFTAYFQMQITWPCYTHTPRPIRIACVILNIWTRPIIIWFIVYIDLQDAFACIRRFSRKNNILMHTPAHSIDCRAYCSLSSRLSFVHTANWNYSKRISNGTEIMFMLFMRHSGTFFWRAPFRHKCV